jgi:30S ribosomal protein S31
LPRYSFRMRRCCLSALSLTTVLRPASIDPGGQCVYCGALRLTNTGAEDMGRGDKRTRKGKIFKSSYGKTRPHSPAKKVAPKPAGRKS